METIMHRKNFQTFIRVFHFTLKAVFVCASILLGFLMLLCGCVALLPTEKIIAVLQKGEINAALNFSGLAITMSDQVVSNFQFQKQYVLALLVMLILYLVVLLFITYCVTAIFKQLKNSQVFTMSNSKYIRWIAYAFIVLSFTLQFSQTMTIYLFDQLFSLSSFMQNSDWIKAVSYNFFSIHWSLLFGGIVIWIIGTIFKYGVFLQEEFDATL
ncbi:MAG: DUF2975 domain-containing protein [Solibacillus sp.]